jgi:hypothetical protein
MTGFEESGGVWSALPWRRTDKMAHRISFSHSCNLKLELDGLRPLKCSVEVPLKFEPLCSFFQKSFGAPTWDYPKPWEPVARSTITESLPELEA